ncbi:MAG: type II secretion system F family protein [Pseudomonadota bacterium]
MDEFIALATNTSYQIAFLVAVATMASIFTFVSPLLKTDTVGARMKRVGEYKDRLRQEQRDLLAKKQSGSIRRVEAKGAVKKLVESLKLLEILDADAARKKLTMAGMRGEAPVFAFMAARLGLPFILAGFTGFYVYVLGVGELGNLEKLLSTVGGFVVGFYLPNIYVSNTITKRQQKVQLAWPDALDLLLICVESGMSIEAALQKVGHEVGTSSPELAEELGLTTAELSYLQDRKIAYMNLAERTGLDGVKAVTTALIQSEKYGTPLGQALRVMANENRELRMQEAEKKAAALPPKLTVPMIVFFLPVLFAVIMGPAAMSIAAGS